MDSHLYRSGTAGAGAPDRPSGLYHQQARRKASQRDAKLLETSRFQILSLNNAVLDCTAQNVHCEHAPVVLQATGLQNYMLGDRIVCRSMPTSPTVENNYMLGDRIVCRSTPTYPTAELNITGHRGADVEYRAGSICREQSVRGQVRPAQNEGSAHPPPRRGLAAQRNWVGAPAARRTNPPAAQFIDAEPAPPQRGLAAQGYWVPGCSPSNGVSVDGVPRDSVLSPADVFNNGRWNLAVGAELCWLLLLGACLCAPELMGRLTRWLIRDERALLSALVVLAASAVPDTAEALLHALLSRSPPPLVQSFAAIHEASAPVASLLYALYLFWSARGFRIPLRMFGAIGRATRWLVRTAIAAITVTGGTGCGWRFSQKAVHVFGCIAVVYTFTSLVTQGDGGRSCMRETDARGARLTRATSHLACPGTVPCERVIAGVGGVHTAMFEADNLPVRLGGGGSTNLADGRSSMALVRTAEVNQNCSLVVASYPSPAPTDPRRRGGQPTVDDGQWPLLVGRGKLFSVSGTNGPSTQGGPADGRRRPVAATCRSRQAILPLRHQWTLDAGGGSRRSTNDQWPPLATNDCLTEVPPPPW